MAKSNSNINAIPATILEKKPVACHEYDNWLIPATHNSDAALFASAVLDVSRGAKTIATILATHLVDLEAIADGNDDTKTLLSKTDTEALARLAVFSLGRLHAMAVSQVDYLNTVAGAGVQA